MNAVLEKSRAFALRIIRLHLFLRDNKREFVLSKQLLRSGTSIGANVNEAQEAQSRPDFISKMHISLKEARETSYWLGLLKEAGFISEKEHDSVHSDCTELIRLLTSIVKSSKAKLQSQRKK